MNNLTTEQIKWLVDKADGFKYIKALSYYEYGYKVYIECPNKDSIPINNFKSSPWFSLLVHRAIDGINKEGHHVIYTNDRCVWVRYNGLEISWYYDGSREEEDTYNFIVENPDQARLSAVLWVKEHEG